MNESDKNPTIEPSMLKKLVSSFKQTKIDTEELG